MCVCVLRRQNEQWAGRNRFRSSTGMCADFLCWTVCFVAGTRSFFEQLHAALGAAGFLTHHLSAPWGLGMVRHCMPWDGMPLNALGTTFQHPGASGWYATACLVHGWSFLHSVESSGPSSLNVPCCCWCPGTPCSMQANIHVKDRDSSKCKPPIKFFHPK